MQATAAFARIMFIVLGLSITGWHCSGHDAEVTQTRQAWGDFVASQLLLSLPEIGIGAGGPVVKLYGLNGEPAVIKAAWCAEVKEQLSHEWDVYQKLEDLQGHMIPIAYAMTTVSIVAEDLAALVLQYLGGGTARDLKTEVWKSQEVQARVWSVYEAIWSKGVTHGDPSLSNLVMLEGSDDVSEENGRLMLIAFGRANANATATDIAREGEVVRTTLMKRNQDGSSGFAPMDLDTHLQ